jgi:hypothetical protein
LRIQMCRFACYRIDTPIIFERRLDAKF